MWQILKAEITYNKYLLLTVYMIALIFFVADQHGVYSIVPNTLVPFFIGYGFLCNTSCKESRERQHYMLPQSLAQHGVARMLFFAFYQGGMLVLWLVMYLLTYSRAPEAIWMILTTNALVLTFRAVGLIFDDAKTTGAPITCAEGWTPENMARRVASFFSFAVVTILILMAAGYYDAGETGNHGFVLIGMDIDWQPAVELRNFLRAPIGALVTNVLFAVAFYVSIAVSLPQRSFVSSR